jgi:hypothetical protein
MKGCQKKENNAQEKKGKCTFGSGGRSNASMINLMQPVSYKFLN